MTGVNTSRKTGKGLWGGRRVIMSIRVDEEIKKQFVPFSKRVFGSVCLPIEAFMAGLMSTLTVEPTNEVYTSNTVAPKVEIDKIVIERNLRPRRRLEFRGEDPDGLVDKFVQDGGFWVKVSVADGVNEHGHGDGCECSRCRGKRG